MTAEQQQAQRGRFDLVYILRVDLGEAATQAAVDRVDEILNGVGATREHTEGWGIRHLAYPVDGQRKGQYVFSRFEVERERLADLRAALKEVPGMLRASITVAIGGPIPTVWQNTTSHHEGR